MKVLRYYKSKEKDDQYEEFFMTNLKKYIYVPKSIYPYLFPYFCEFYQKIVYYFAIKNPIIISILNDTYENINEHTFKNYVKKGERLLTLLSYSYRSLKYSVIMLFLLTIVTLYRQKHKTLKIEENFISSILITIGIIAQFKDKYLFR
jgi:hypothetical protein